ncbi:MAG TPA: hypothetical protein VMS21_14950, partial [Methylomirabilota bacterium]|nr:hypothetical protein [Methylomirabilota bacterium]
MKTSAPIRHGSVHLRTTFCCLIACVVSVVILPASAVPWASRHDMTAAEYQTEFNKWTGDPYNYRLLSVSGYEKGGAARYAAVWGQEPGPGWITHPGMTQAQFENVSAGYAADGFFPVFLSAFSIGNQIYYNAIWEQSPGADVVTETGLPHHDYVAMNSVHTSQGYELVHLWTCSAGGVDYYSGIWRKGDPAGYAVRTRLTSAQYQQEFENLGAQGYQLITVSAAVVNGQSLFTGVWKTPGHGDAWVSHHDLTEMNYQAQTWNWQYQGYRPVFASAFNPAGGERFNVIFRRNGGMTPANLAVIDDAINGYMQSNSIPGLSLAISRNGELVYAKGFGQADQGANEWVHPLHRF